MKVEESSQSVPVAQAAPPSTVSELNMDNAGLCEEHEVAESITNNLPPVPQLVLHTVHSERMKKSLLVLVAFVSTISPFSTTTYYPSVVALSQALRVSVPKINFTISTYQV